jgi:hypothetical protein
VVRGRAGWPGVRPGRQCEEHLAAAAACVEAMCEREKREKERAGPSTIPAYIRRVDTSADEHK